jgi:hypothetical protein
MTPPLAEQPAPPTPDEVLPQTPTEQLLWEVCDLVSLWKHGVIKGLPRADRNAAIEATRERIIALVDAGAALPDRAIAAALSTTAAQAEAKYREALEPFANHAGLAAFPDASDDRLLMVSVGDLRRAAAILAQTTPQETK